MKTIACFFTGGHTESNSMTSFLYKINPEFQFRQLCPNRTKKRKRPNGEDLIDREVSGLTGAALIRYVNSYIHNHKAELSSASAILLEDDLDGKYYEELVSGDKSSIRSRRTPEFNNRCTEIRASIRSQLGKDDSFPIILMYAAPEIEAWFVADWDHTFGQIYGPKGIDILSTEENLFFSTRFRRFVNQTVLLEYADCIEHYGYFIGKYKKLSDEIIGTMDVFKESLASSKDQSPYIASISFNKELRYSKKEHGDGMLALLSPDDVYRKCPTYFREAVDQLKQLT